MDGNNNDSSTCTDDKKKLFPLEWYVFWGSFPLTHPDNQTLFIFKYYVFLLFWVFLPTAVFVDGYGELFMW